ncbi:hypothetical protein [Archaeoglobus neptunius]|uniref:hypothetical protein n=1 Tax=Archaeoglobus neptunius TaxID=2798580 RepID=UPI0019274827|nr:hypothetical protein [Archaeoglobus neptunius]
MECVVDIREEFYDGDCVKRLVVYLPSLGCEWAFWGAGCNMCGHYLSQGFSVVLTPEEIFTAFIKTYKKYRLDRYSVINLYNNGSFFNDRELPEHIRLKILEKLSCCKKLKVVVVESRPEYISEYKIRSAVEILGGKKLEVASLRTT